MVAAAQATAVTPVGGTALRSSIQQQHLLLQHLLPLQQPPV